MDIEDLKQRLIRTVDQWFDGNNTDKQKNDSLGTIKSSIEQFAPETPVRVLPEGKRVVRTGTSGDRVYFLDDVKKTRQWVTNPDVLDSLGFNLEDVTEVEEDELLKYQMGSALYKRVDAN